MLKVLPLIIITILLIACGKEEPDKKTNTSQAIPWIETVDPIVIDGEEFYGTPCSVIRISNSEGVKKREVIFKAPPDALAKCPKGKRGFNYLDYDDTFITLNVYRQRFGAGSTTGERYRSKDFETWEEYIGITWVDSEEYEAWRKVGSTSATADSRTKVIHD